MCKPKQIKSKLVCKNFSIFHQNIRGLQSSIEALEITLTEIKPNLVVLSEHKMLKSITNRLNLENYTVKSDYSRKSSRGGGVVILTKNSNSSKCKQVSFPEVDNLLSDQVFECCMVEITNVLAQKPHKVLLVGFYRNPIKKNDHESIDRINRLLEIIQNKYCHIVIVGDFNIDLTKNESSSKSLNNTLISHGMRYLVDFPTRITDTSESVIDNVFTNIHYNQINVTGLNTQLSDHDGQLIEIITSKKHLKTNVETQTSLEYTRKLNKTNIENFLKSLDKETWMEVYMSPIDLKYDTFHEILMHNFNINFPKTLSRKHNNIKPWFSKELKIEKQKIIDLSNIARATGDKSMFRELRLKNKMYKKKLIDKKKKYYQNKVESSNNVIKSSWSIINSEVGINTHRNENFKLKINNKDFSCPSEVSNIFNNHFSNVFVEEIMPKLKQFTAQSDECDMNTLINSNNTFAKFNPLEEIEVGKIIDGLKNKYTSGYDEIPPILIKQSKNQLVKPLTHLINSSFISSKFPEKLKIAKIKPIFKKGDKSNVNNYRPIALLPAISKIYEKAVHNQLVDFLEKNNILNDYQHGFRQGRSVITAATDFIESVLDSLDNHEQTVGLFLDLSKAFDSLSHDLLYFRLHNLGIQKLPLNWLKSYLCNRKQFVEISNHNQTNFKDQYRSSISLILHGVPQGSILGPLLFACYITNLPTLDVSNKLCLYADDTNLKVSAPTGDEVEALTNHSLNALHEYFSQSKLLLNMEKTKFIVFSTHKANRIFNPTLSCKNHQLSDDDETKFLGLTIDKNLNWNSHVECIMQKISSGLYALRKMQKLCDTKTLKSIYFAYIHSNIAFGISLYGATSINNLNSILKSQKKAIRIILNLKNSSSVRDHFISLKILTVYGLYIYETVLGVKLNLGNLQLLGDFHNYNTRHRNELAVPSHNLQIYTKKPQYAGTKFFNHLPQNIKSEQNLRTFKRKLKEYLIEKAIYSFDSYYSS